MKRSFLLLSLVLVAGVAFANEAKKADAAKPAEKAAATQTAATATKPAEKTHEVQAEIVSVDMTAKTITIKSDPANKTFPADEKALTALKEKAGQKVTLICRDNEKGEHVAVAGVKAETKAPAAPDKK